jgi:carboxymethylenebutenolidase
MTRVTDVTIDAPGGPLPAFFAKSDDFPNPSVIVIQEWWGLNGHIQDVALRFAAEGYTAVAPDLYRGKQTDEPDEARKLMMAMDEDQVVEDLKAVVGWLLESGAPTVGVVGFCMGGSVAFRFAFEEERLNAAVVFYGSADVSEKELHCPLIAHYGTEDDWTPEQLEEIRRLLARSHYASEVFVYEGAKHAFFNDTGDTYDEDAAQPAWERTLAFFRNELGE